MKAVWREIGKDREKTQLRARPKLYPLTSAVTNPITSENNVTKIRSVRKLNDIFLGCGLCRHISNATQTALLTNAAMKVPIALPTAAKMAANKTQLFRQPHPNDDLARLFDIEEADEFDLLLRR